MAIQFLGRYPRLNNDTAPSALNRATTKMHVPLSPEVAPSELTICRIPPSPKKKNKKDIDTKTRNLVSRAPGSETDEGFLPGRFFVREDPQ
jgi:hypothetical protein